MAAGGDDAPGYVEEAFAPEMRRQRLAGVEVAAMEVAPSVGQQPDVVAPKNRCGA